jgi:phosphatidylethanolamine/phosphatidyl-N-methylethanolamine N-methyltransferase
MSRRLESPLDVSVNRVFPAVANRIKDLSSIALFVGELISNPRSIGAPIPSSRALARRMASYIPHRPKGYVIELGPGTGVITEAILDRGIPMHRLILVERSYEMAKMLRKKFPGVKMIFGDAAQLGKLLAKHIDLETERVECIVSSLPLRSLPKPVVEAITGELQRVLSADGRFIQYTYDIRHGCNGTLRAFTRIRSRTVWMNIPPARVEVYNVPSKSPAS